MSADINNKFDLTNGPILKKLFLIAVPIMGIQLMQMAYNLTDMFWLGRVGSNAVAASGTAGMYMWLSQALLMIGRMGSEIGVSQSLGKKDIEKARSFSQNALLISVILGTAFGLCMIIFRDQLVGFFNIKDAEVAASAAKYLAITGIAIPSTYISGVITGTYNASGNSRIPFFINAVGLLLNMILDPLLIFVFDLEITGAAIATIIAQITVSVIFLFSIKTFKSRPFHIFKFIYKLDKIITRKIFLWSTPIALESMFFTFLSMIVSRFVAEWGTQAMAVQRVGAQIESLTWLIGIGFSSALTAFIGQNYGAGKWTRIHQSYKLSARVMILWGAVVTLILWFLGGFIFSLFLKETTSIDMGSVYLKILAVCQILACIEYISAGAFRGIGKTMQPSITSIFSNVLRIPMVYFLSRTSLGINGIWWGITISAMIRSILMYFWYKVTAGKMPKKDIPDDAA